MPTITFLGAARTVTGSKYLLELEGSRLLVDCGLFQGLKELRERNWQPLPVDAASIDAVILTHAHLDHCGYLPRLVAEGFTGRIFCTQGTGSLCRIVLPDAGRLQEEDAELANKRGYSKHTPALPLFTEEDANRALVQLQLIGYDRPVPVADGVEATFTNAGHLLGSSYVKLTFADGGGRPKTLLFGGDLGRYDRPVMPDPTPATGADVLLVESTYGNRLHPPSEEEEKLAAVVNETIKQGGKLIIPSFAIGRAEEVLYWLRRLEEEKRIPQVPVFLDSPMAARAREQYAARLDELDPEIREASEHLRARLHAEHRVCAFCTARFQVVSSPKESRQLVDSKAPAIIVSSSGMASGGRVLHHLRAALPDERHTVLFVGYQAAGTRGRRLLDGDREVKIHGEIVPVRARIERIDSMSAHADSSEILRWLGGFERPPAMTFLVHGEPEAMDALEATIDQRLGWRTMKPEHKQTVDLAEFLS
jgi:metallo-beta-lactamase family protein